jgi:transposase
VTRFLIYESLGKIGRRVRTGERVEYAAAKARGQKLGRQTGQRVKADRLALKVLQMVEQGSSYRKIAQALHLSKITVNGIVQRHRQAHPDIQIKQPSMATRKQSTPQTIYQLKITLKDICPPIWRRLQVTSERMLRKLHQVIQESMGWTNSHLHTFLIGDVEYGQPMPEYGL